MATSLLPTRDVRAVTYGVFGFGALGAALVSGRPELVALAVPFLVALAVGLRSTGPLAVDARLVLDADRLIEGDETTGRVDASWDGAFDVQVAVDRLVGIEPVEPAGALAWAEPGAPGAVSFPLRVRATRWGRHTVGDVWVRARGPLGLVTWTGRVAVGPMVRVLPGSERLTWLLDPAESRTVNGVHRTRLVGDGGEFAELRPYVPGDRLRDLNWGATARLGEPYVNRHHPERSGEVVIVVDAFGDDSVGSTEALSRAARAAWAVASVHLQGNDRVGLVGLGRRIRWLHPAGGRRARYQLLEALLDVGATVVDRERGERGDRSSVPASALIVALSPLHDSRVLGPLQAWQARGRTVAVVRIDIDDLWGPVTSPLDASARRLWALEIDGNARKLTDLGIPVVTVGGDGPIMPAVTALRRARRGAVVRAR